MTRLPMHRIDPATVTEGDRRRFWSKVDRSESGCWRWSAFVAGGYGRFTHRGRNILAHRMSYTLCRGEIPGGLVIDHLCRTTSCVNPDHLRAVSWKTNTMQNSLAYPAINAAKSHCKRGHPLRGENLLRNPSGNRACRECRDARMRTPEARARSNEYQRKWLERDPEGKRAYQRSAYAKRMARKRRLARQEVSP